MKFKVKRLYRYRGSRIGWLLLPISWIWRGCWDWGAAWTCVRIAMSPLEPAESNLPPQPEALR